ncbi:hypothetical protein QEZ54_34075 [Catellatospora sp. KI3]|uniref:hypothetical protein n=1 Tax=Catellatospora sp. KI3 TaxID=3041620 RepID=UPI0024821710|nr:hypothetical protein [Catellatospora sp. KI3]MDI1466016.1 hypothetical protein [Catellatospora sp. KI3]
MSARPPLNPDDTDRLLDGEPSAAYPRLRRALAEAAAPGDASELAGLAAAMTAYRQSAAAGRGRRRGTLRRALAFKIAAVVAATAVGGVAFAASTGVLPGPFFRPSPPSTSAPASPSAPGASAAGPGGSPSASASPSQAAMPLPSTAAKVHGQCRSYLSDPGKAKATTNPAYAELVAAAAGRDLAAFCTRLLAAQPSPGGQRPNPDPSKKPEKSPHAVPSPHRSGDAPDGVTPAR